tara:strand:+ start:2339 stop:2497 length:159 start_codon:yes stop_codon:yes gene_type:complete
MDMPPDYTGMKTIWAHDAKAALKTFTGKVCKLGDTVTRKNGATIKITDIEQL